MDHRGYTGIAVRKEFRGHGVGTILMKETLDTCRGKFDIVHLGVFSVNKGAIRLYERLGFRRYGSFPGAVKSGDRHLDTEQMYLRL
jgi:ribosomal protein S18 acetylase RimI-like enzyme